MRWLVALVALSVLAGCSGGSEPAPEPTATKPSAKSATTPSAAAPTGEPAPEALSAFRCEPAEDDKWEAAGFLANGGKKSATYQVSVYVGPLDGESRRIRTKQVTNVASGGSVRFVIGLIPADGDECHVQVIRSE